jgi:hypothetical protein
VTDEQDLYAVMSRICEKHQARERLVPTWLANEAMRELDPERKSPPAIYTAAHLQFRQIARGFCRRHFEGDGESPQHELLPDLQDRYPAARTKDAEEPEYVKREAMNPEDARFNVKRLELEARTKQRHADALRAWARNRWPDYDKTA